MNGSATWNPDSGAYDYGYDLHYYSASTTTWRLPVLNDQAIQNIAVPGEMWSYSFLTRPDGGWDPAIWDPTQLGSYAKGNVLDDPPFLLEFVGPEVSGSLSGFRFESPYGTVDAPGNITDGFSTTYFDPPTPNAPAIPEPCSCALLFAGALPLLARRRCHR